VTYSPPGPPPELRLASARLIIPQPPGSFFGRDTGGDPPSEISLLVPPEVLFPGTAANESALLDTLANLSRDDTLFECARANIVVTGAGGDDQQGRQQRLLYRLLTSGEIDQINAFARAHQAGLPIVFFRGQLLELMRWVARHCQNLPGDGTTYADPNTRRNFVKAALIAGMLWSYRVYGTRLRGDGNIEIRRNRAMGAFRKAMEESNFTPNLARILGRGWSLFTEYLPRRYPTFQAEFGAASNLTIDQFLTCAAALGCYMIVDNPQGPLFIAHTVAAATSYNAEFQSYLEREAQVPNRLATTLWDDFAKVGYRYLRQRPVMITGDGRGIILDPCLFCDRITIGPLFHLISNAARKKANEIFGAFGLAFEDYATDILRRIYPTRPGLVDRLHCNVKGENAAHQDFEIDAVLDDARKSIIFEMKACFLREEAILDERSENFLDHVREKYGSTSKKGERGKGVAQLARIIGAIARREWSDASTGCADATTIYPVLVTHDSRMDTPTLGKFLAEEFTKLLSTVPAKPGIEPLIIMTVDDLENIEASTQNFSIAELLSDYSHKCPDRMRSLHNFMQYSPKYQAKMLANATLTEKATKLMAQVQGRLFPSDLGNSEA
jgi:hypothetical protein